MSNGDVLVALRAWRDEFARSHGYDLHAMAATLRELDCAAGQKVVRGEPRRPEAAKPAETRMPNQLYGLESQEGAPRTGLNNSSFS